MYYVSTDFYSKKIEDTRFSNLDSFRWINFLFKIRLTKFANLKISFVGLEKIPKTNKRRAFNKDVGPGKNNKLLTVGPTSIPDPRVCMKNAGTHWVMNFS